MHKHVRTSFSLVAVAVLAFFSGSCDLAQSTASPTAGNGTYVTTDPLANVRYDNRYDFSLGMAYGHIHAGPEILQGANLGGLDLDGSYWFSKHWAVEGSGRGYLGTSGVGSVEGNSIRGPFVSQYLFVGGAEWLGPHNKHGDLIAHAMVGGAHFDSHDFPSSPPGVGFYDTQFAPAAVFGGHMDLNRSAHWVFRITPDAMFTRYGYSFAAVPPTTNPHNNWNFGISAGVQYKFSKKR
ncbi:MAG: hypothetical protein ABR905_09745 [Terracidiphilus sp.]|jgi:hypothetical protein